MNNNNERRYDIFKDGVGSQVRDDKNRIGVVVEIIETAPEWIEALVMFEGQQKAERVLGSLYILGDVDAKS